MEKKYTYQTKGTCSRQIEFVLDGDIVADVKFLGGCSGNTQGLSALVRGMTAQQAIQRLKGIRCGSKSTSCPDQLAAALSQAINEN